MTPMPKILLILVSLSILLLACDAPITSLLTSTPTPTQEAVVTLPSEVTGRAPEAEKSESLLIGLCQDFTTVAELRASIGRMYDILALYGVEHEEKELLGRDDLDGQAALAQVLSDLVLDARPDYCRVLFEDYQEDRVDRRMSVQEASGRIYLPPLKAAFHYQEITRPPTPTSTPTLTPRPKPTPIPAPGSIPGPPQDLRAQEAPREGKSAIWVSWERPANAAEADSLSPSFDQNWRPPDDKVLVTSYMWRVIEFGGENWYYGDWKTVGGWGRCLWGCDFTYKHLTMRGARVGTTYTYEVRAVSGDIVGPPDFTTITFTGKAGPREPVEHTLFDWSKDFSELPARGESP